jgi:hypothetical protein
MRSRVSSGWRHTPLWVVAAIPMLVFLLFAMRELMLPGVQFDEVNPDYLVVKMLDASKVGTTPSWQLRDNILSHDFRWPVIATYYAGVVSVYLSIPFHAVLGFNVFTLRFYHACFGLAILALSFAVIYRITRCRLAALTGTLLLALDAGFLLTFRTQFELQMLQLPFLLLTVLLLLDRPGDPTSRPPSPRQPPSPSRYLCAGLSFGVGCYGYFIIGFFLPALLLHLYLDRARLGRPHWLAFFVGAAIGALPWFFAMASMWRFAHHAGQNFFADLVQVADIFLPGQTAGWSERLRRPLSLLADAIANLSQPRMVTEAAEASVLTDLKLNLTLLSGLAACVGAWAWGTSAERRGAWLLIGLVASFLGVASIFGARVAVHHLNVNIPLVYMLLAVSLAPWMRALGALSHRMVGRAPSGPGAILKTPLTAVALPVALLATFFAISLAQQASLFRELRRTGGAGDFSEMRVFLAYDLLSNYKTAVSFFPDWGFFAQVVYLSRGEVQIDPSLMPEPAALKRVLCSGKDALIVVKGGDRRSVADAAAAGADAVITRWKTYFQRDGRVNFELAVIAAPQPGLTCGRVGSAASIRQG